MSSRMSGMLVTFDQDLSEEWTEGLRRAILSFKHVTDVQPIESDPSVEMTIKARVHLSLQRAILDVLRKELSFR